MATLYQQPESLVGAVLIGDIPFVIYEMMQNGDDDVDESDLAVLAADLGRTDCSMGCEGGIDGDDDVDGSDLASFAADINRTDCP